MNKLLEPTNIFDTKLIIFVVIGIVISALIVIIAKIIVNKRVHYSKKDCLLTPTEKQYYKEFCEIFGEGYIVLPQINLASVINKDSKGFRSELFRNADFGVFDTELHPLLLIEINDRSHLREDRIARDANVNKICKIAGLPLVTFWTKDGINRSYFIKVFKKYF